MSETKNTEASEASVANTRPVPAAHAFDETALHDWLQKNVAGYAGPLTVQSFKGGQSNPTYKLDTPARSYVMRAKPGPVAKLLPSAHAIEREYTVMQALQGSRVPVPQMLALCEDESVIGRAFYIMAYLPGRVLWDQSLPGMTPEQRRAIYLELNRVMAELHRFEIGDALAGYGKHEDYVARQTARWSKQYRASADGAGELSQPIPEMERLLDWLPAHLPESAKNNKFVSVVHGDYRLDNVMFDQEEPRVIAVLDWELSTLGHPLADFAYHCLSWHIPPGPFRGIGGLDLAALGIPSEDEYIALYCERTQFATPEQLRADWSYYLAYNMFRIAAILQGIAKRVEVGTASNAQARQSAAGAKPMAALAWQFAEKFEREQA